MQVSYYEMKGLPQNKCKVLVQGVLLVSVLSKRSKYSLILQLSVHTFLVSLKVELQTYMKKTPIYAVMYLFKKKKKFIVMKFVFNAASVSI